MTKPAAPIAPAAEQVELTAEQVLTAEVKALLKQYKLKRAIVETKSQNVIFDETLIKRLLEKDAEAYTEITA